MSTTEKYVHRGLGSAWHKPDSESLIGYHRADLNLKPSRRRQGWFITVACGRVIGPGYLAVSRDSQMAEWGGEKCKRCFK